MTTHRTLLPAVLLALSWAASLGAQPGSLRYMWASPCTLDVVLVTFRDTTARHGGNALDAADQLDYHLDSRPHGFTRASDGALIPGNTSYTMDDFKRLFSGGYDYSVNGETPESLPAYTGTQTVADNGDGVSETTPEVFGSLRHYFHVTSGGAYQLHVRILNLERNGYPVWVQVPQTKGYYAEVRGVRPDPVTGRLITPSYWNHALTAMRDSVRAWRLTPTAAYDPPNHEDMANYPENRLRRRKVLYLASGAEFRDNRDGNPNSQIHPRVDRFGSYRYVAGERQGSGRNNRRADRFGSIGVHAHEVGHLLDHRHPGQYWLGTNPYTRQTTDPSPPPRTTSLPAGQVFGRARTVAWGVMHGPEGPPVEGQQLNRNNSNAYTYEYWSCPNPLSAAYRRALGWVTPTPIPGTTLDQPVEPGNFYSFQGADNRTYTMEFRTAEGYGQYTSWYRFSEAPGVLIWKSYETGRSGRPRRGSNQETWLITADNRRLFNAKEDSDAGDPSPRQFTPGFVYAWLDRLSDPFGAPTRNDHRETFRAMAYYAIDIDGNPLPTTMALNGQHLRAAVTAADDGHFRVPDIATNRAGTRTYDHPPSRRAVRNICVTRDEADPATGSATVDVYFDHWVGDIAGMETWGPDPVYVGGDVRILDGASLTIADNTAVRFLVPIGADDTGSPELIVDDNGRLSVGTGVTFGTVDRAGARIAAHGLRVETGGTATLNGVTINEGEHRWSGQVTVAGDLTVAGGTHPATLLVEADATVLFEDSDETRGGEDPTRSELIVEGTLTATESGITFGSSNTTDPSHDDWYGIRVASGGTATLIGVTVRDAEHCAQAETGGILISSRVTLSNCGSVPPAPGNLRAAPGDGEVVLTWETPANNGTVLTGYEYRQSTDGGTIWSPDWGPVSLPADTEAADLTEHTVENLSHGQTYTFELRAENAIGTGPASEQASVALLTVAFSESGYTLIESGNPVLPGEVIGQAPDPTQAAKQVEVVVEVTPATDRGLTIPVELTGSAEPDDYRHDLPEGGLSLSANQTSAQFTISALLDEDVEDETIQVAFGTLPAGVSAGDPATATATLYDTPSAPAVTAQGGNGSVTLRWDEAGNPGIEGWQYRIRPVTSEGVWSEWKPVRGSTATATEYTVDGLDNGVNYQFKVRAYTARGYGQESAQVEATPAVDVPDAPGNLSADSGDGEVTLTWETPDNNGSALTGYEYRQSTDGGVTWSPDWGPISLPAGTVAADLEEHTVTGLSNGQAYTFEVRARNGAGQGAASRATATPAREPDAPGNLSADSGDGEVTLTWETPDDNGSALTGYEFRQSTDGGVTWSPDWGPISLPAGTVAADLEEHTVTGLSNGQAYTFEVRARNGAGQGAAAQVPGTPQAPPSAPLAPEDVRAGAGHESVTLRWSDPGNASVTGWEYRVRRSGGSWGEWTSMAGSDASTTSYTVTGLTNGVGHLFRVRAVAGSSAGPGSSVVTATPHALTAEAGYEEVTLRWVDPGNAGITGWAYQVRRGRAGWGNWTPMDGSDASTTSYTVTGLDNGVSYRFKVRALNAGRVELTLPVVAATPDASLAPPPPPRPPRPAGGQAVSGFTQVQVSWSPVTATPAVSGYDVQGQSKPVSGGTWPATWPTLLSGSGTVEGAVRVFIHESLDPDRLYRYRVRSLRGAEESAWSDTLPSVSGVQPRPGAATGVTASRGDGQVTLSWTGPAHTHLTGWQYRSGTVSGSDTTWSPSWQAMSGSGASTRRHTVENLSNGVAYTFRVRALNAAGEGAPSAPSSAVIPAAVPDAPAALTATPGALERMVLAWQTPADNGSPLTEYEYRQSTNGGATWSPDWTGVPGSGATTRSHEFSGLPGLSYTFQVRALNAAGEGAASRASGFWYEENGSDAVASFSSATGLSGTDAADFGLSSGTLGFASAPNFEEPADEDTDNLYEVAVQSGSSVQEVRVRVTDGNDPGTVSLSTTTPQMGEQLTAVVEDQDGVSNLGVVWISRTPDPSGSADETSTTGEASITPSAEHVGKHLRVRVTYDDRHGPQALVSDETEPVTTPAGPPDAPGALTATPEASSSLMALTWQTPADNGAPLMGYQYRRSSDGGATWDPDWTGVPGSDGTTTDQGFSNLPGLSYTFEVRALNAAGEGAASRAAGFWYAENGTGAVASFSSATGLTGTDEADFGLSSGTLRFASAPDFEAAVDEDTDNLYEVAVWYGHARHEEVRVRVTNEDEAGTVTLPAMPEVDLPLTAELTDPDEVTGAVVWRWERQTGASWTMVSVEAEYTPTSEDEGHRLRATAIYTDGHGPNKTASAETEAVTAPPPPPPPVLPTPVGGPALSGVTQVRVTWLAASASPALSGYDLEEQSKGIGEATWPQAWTSLFEDGPGFVASNLRFYHHDDLDPDRVYRYRVRSRRGAEEPGPWSTLLPSASGVQPKPGPATGLTATAGNEQVELAWTGPALRHLTGWQYRQGVISGSRTTWAPQWQPMSNSDADTRSHTVQNLTNGVTYTFRVRALNAAGAGAASEPLPAVSPAPPAPEPPDAPGGLTATPGVSSKTMALTWQTPADNGAPLTWYDYRRSTDGGATWDPDWTRVPGSGATTTSHEFFNLPGLSYTFQVRALNAAGEGAGSEHASGFWYAERGTGAVASFSSATGLTGTDTGDFSLSSGTLRFASTPDFEEPADANRDNLYKVAIWYGPSRHEEVRVRVTDADDPGTVSLSTSTPRVGERLTAELHDPDGVEDLQWRWFARSPGPSGAVDETPTTAEKSITPSAQFVGKHLRVRVSYTDRHGRQTLESAETEPVRARPEPPDAPARLTATPGVSSKTMALTWRTPADNGSALTEYQYRQSPNGGATWSPDWTGIPGSGATTRSHEFSGLPGLAYTFEVRARNGEGEGAASEHASGIWYEENGTGAVASFSSATGLTGADTGDFALLSGTLRFASAPNFEAPVDANRDNLYSVAVWYGHARHEEVRVRVTDADDPGTVSLSSAQPRVDREVTAEVHDEDGTTGVSWQWERQTAGSWGTVSGATAAGYTPTSEDQGHRLRATATYTDAHGRKSLQSAATEPVAEVVTNRPPVIDSGASSVEFAENGTGPVASYTASDPDGDALVWSLTGTHASAFAALQARGPGPRVLRFNQAPDFEAESSYAVKVKVKDTGTPADSVLLDVTVTITDVAEPPRAPDLRSVTPPSANGHDRLQVTWAAAGNAGRPSLSGYRVEYCSGHCKSIQTAWPHHKDLSDGAATATTLTGLSANIRYFVRVRAKNAEGDGAWSNVRNAYTANRAPVLSGLSSKSFDENGTGQVAAYTASDPDGHTLAWSLTGTDASAFRLDEGPGPRALYFRAAPDHEDENHGPSYAVTVKVKDNGTPADSTLLDVTVTVADVNESGTVTLSPTQPVAEEELTATLSDPDTVETVTWAWFSSTPPRGISGAVEKTVSTSKTITVSRGLIGKQLQAQATYTDKHGSDIVTSAKSAAVVGKPDPPQDFQAVTGDGQVSLSWRRPASLGGLPLLRYERRHRAGSGSWQSWVGVGTATSAVVQNLTNDQAYTFEVRAVNAAGDGEAASDTETPRRINQPPVITSGSTSVDFDEEGTGAVATYTAFDPDGDAITWSLKDAGDAEDFTITSPAGIPSGAPSVGLLRFSSTPNYERPRDSDTNNIYTLTVEARDAAHPDDPATRLVTVEVRNVDEPGAVGLSNTRPRVGNTLRAVLTDPDGGLSDDATGWTWQKLQPGFAGASWEDIVPDGVTGAAVPDTTLEVAREHVGFVLRARADYTDAHGPGKVAASGGTEPVPPPPNQPPVIDDDSPSSPVNFAENGTSAVATFAASDPEGTTLDWSLTGTDAGDFTISSGGVLRFSSTPDYENAQDSNTNNIYSLTVKVTDRGSPQKSDTRSFTVRVTDVNEAPRTPSAPSVSAASSNGHERLSVSWSAPSHSGRPPIDDYDVQFRPSGTSSWSSHSFSGTGRETTISNLSANTLYYVQVRASNDEGTGSWSGSGSGRTNEAPNQAPVINDNSPSSPVNFAENRTSAVATFTASDPEGTTLDWSLTGTDAGDFTISSGGVLSFDTTPDYENAQDSNTNNIYSLTVKVTDRGSPQKSDTRSFTVRVTDVNEAPRTPSAPSVSAASSNGHERLSVSWSAPSHSGRPPIDDYDVQFRPSGTSSWSSHSFSGTGTATTISSGLTANTLYYVQVRAKNDEGTGSWSSSGSGRTDEAPNRAPVITSGPTSVSVAERGSRTVATYTASDPDDDNITWSDESTDAGDFTISADGVLRFSFTPDFENPRDSNTNNIYVVRVRATDDGDPQKSATRTVTVRVTNVNEPPVISGPSGQVQFTENGVGTVASFSASDPEGDRISWSDESTDAGDFTISASGTLRFSYPPDFENPRDSNTNNLYVVRVKATDNGSPAKSATRTVLVRVNDANEPPRTPSAPSVTPLSYTQVRVTWSAPSNSGRPPIDDYDVRYRREDSSSWRNRSFAGTGNTTIISNLISGPLYYVQVRAKNDEGHGSWSASGSGRTRTGARKTAPDSAGVDSAQVGALVWEGGELTATVTPNPFNPSTTIRLTLPEPGPVSLTLYNVTGQVVRRLLLHQYREAGIHTLTWDGRDDQGRDVAGGVYLYRLLVSDQVLLGKITLLR